MWIALEGPDKSGKSKVLEALRYHLPPECLTREPGSPHDPICARLRELILDDRATELASGLMFLADRAQHYEKVVAPLLENGNIVVQDRSALSALVYQVLTNTHPCRSVLERMLHTVQEQSVLPDLIILLSVDEEILAQRRVKIDDKFEMNLSQVDDAYRRFADPSDRCHTKWVRLLAKKVVALPHNTPADTIAVVGCILSYV